MSTILIVIRKYAYVCVYVLLMWVSTQKSKESNLYPGFAVVGSCRPPDMDAESQAGVLFKRDVLLTTEPPLVWLLGNSTTGLLANWEERFGPRGVVFIGAGHDWEKRQSGGVCHLPTRSCDLPTRSCDLPNQEQATTAGVSRSLLFDSGSPSVL